jgi:hypothetical protein
MKKILFSFLFLGAVLATKAQDIEAKKGIITIDGKECLHYNAKDPNNVSFSTLDGEDVMYLLYLRPHGNLYCKLVFVKQKKFLTTKYAFTKVLLMKRLLETKVIVDCKIDEDKVDNFIMRMHEEIDPFY